ncbi:ABC transporter ATP-binding protein [Synechococcus sp. RSCCF101]|nr:ABC transporter ATP-binding protein [Synechococcus sp. RSCCF101]
MTTLGNGLALEAISRSVGGRTIIDRVSLQVEPGECLALLGPSGCGKSTILRLIAGLDAPSSGEIRLAGEAITHWPPARRRVGMVFQSYALYPHLDVWRNLTLGLQVRGVRPTQQQEAVERVLSLLQLEEVRHRRPSALSGGQRQRVALARALLRSPSLYLLDEPMSNLDAQLREDLRPQLRRWLCGGEQPVVYVTHDQQEAMGLADRIAVLLGGRLQQVGTPQELYERPASLVVACFIGRPQINLFPEQGGRVLAVRPEHLHACDDPDAGLPARVVSREWLGATQLVSVDTPRGALRWLADGKVAVPDSLRLGWRPEREHWFEAGSGARLPVPPSA